MSSMCSSPLDQNTHMLPSCGLTHRDQNPQDESRSLLVSYIICPGPHMMNGAGLVEHFSSVLTTLTIDDIIHTVMGGATCTSGLE